MRELIYYRGADTVGDANQKKIAQYSRQHTIGAIIRMFTSFHRWYIAVVLALSVMTHPSSVLGDDGKWKFERDNRGHPSLTFYRSNRSVFSIGQGRAFGLHFLFTHPVKREGKRIILIASGSRQMKLRGDVLSSGNEAALPYDLEFEQWDLGFNRQDPELFGERWLKRQRQLFDILDSGQAITITFEKRKFILPPVNVKWRDSFLNSD